MLFNMIDSRLDNRIDEYAKRDSCSCNADNRRHVIDTETVTGNLTDVYNIIRLNVVVLRVHDIFRSGIKGLDGRYAVLLAHKFNLLATIKLT